MIVYHKHRGPGVITQECRVLQQQNSDPTTVFVEFAPGDIAEVTAALVTYPGVYEILQMWMDVSLYLGSAFEDKIPELKKARTLTGVHLREEFKQ